MLIFFTLVIDQLWIWQDFQVCFYLLSWEVLVPELWASIGLIKVCAYGPDHLKSTISEITAKSLFFFSLDRQPTIFLLSTKIKLGRNPVSSSHTSDLNSCRWADRNVEWRADRRVRSWRQIQGRKGNYFQW